MNQKVSLAEGAGGAESNKLINSLFFKHFANELLVAEDSATFSASGRMAMTTDGYTVKPIFFAGGDIGKLSVCGTCNDLAVSGARPLYIAASVIIEEGFSLESLEQIVISMAAELAKNGAKVITGDTKVVPKGAVDEIFITTAGVGEVVINGLSSANITEGDAVIVSGGVGEHGAAIFACREGIELESALLSDCASLWPVIKELASSGVKIKAMRDATRGGLAAVLNEWAAASKVCLQLNEADIPVKQEVRGICELLGFEPFSLACEGRFVLAIAKEDAEKVLGILKQSELGKDAAIIGKADMSKPGKVILSSEYGTRRFLEMPTGELLPRIC